MDLDFLIYYEHASRELESDCYLASILKHRGFKVKVINRHQIQRVFLNPKVIIVPYLYGDKDVHEFTGYINGRSRAIVNLQYEQMLNDVGLKADFYHPSNNAKDAYHLCWGNVTKERLINDGIPDKQLPIVGSIGMDFNRPELRKLLKNKQQLAKEFLLDPNKDWHLFISSFSLCSLSKTDLDIIEKKLPGYYEFVDVAKKSQTEILPWIREMAIKYPEKEFIYRPHPNEHNTHIVDEIASTVRNIHVIGNYSIRQWINICETSSSWFSTSTVDCYFAQRPCCVLRPVKIPEKFDQKIFAGCEFLTSKEQFEHFLGDDKPQTTPLRGEILGNMYLTDMLSLYGDLTANACEVALEGGFYPFKRKWKDCLRSFKYDLLAEIFRIFPSLGRKDDSRFHRFHVIAQETRRDSIVLSDYLSKFDDFWRDGR